MNRPYIQLIAISAILLNSCRMDYMQSAPPSPSLEPTVNQTSTPDPCAPENLGASVKEVNDLMREFDDASILAANLAREQAPALISEMQRIRREAENHEIPPCLSTLKSRQLAHMNSVINTMIAFVGGADSNTLNSGLSQARQEHDQYSLEIARLLGVTLVPNANPTPDGTPTP